LQTTTNSQTDDAGGAYGSEGEGGEQAYGEGYPSHDPISNVNPGAKIGGFREVVKVKASMAKARRAHQRATRAAEHEAWESLVLNADRLVTDVADRMGWEHGDVDRAEPVKCHPSHVMAATRTTGHIYCLRCAARSATGRLRLLAVECQGLKQGNTSNLRLLQSDVPPAKGAVLPGFAVRHNRKRGSPSDGGPRRKRAW
jgi:hypothetical protein